MSGSCSLVARYYIHTFTYNCSRQTGDIDEQTMSKQKIQI